MKLNATCSIGRPSYSDPDDRRQVVISIMDQESRSEFCEIAFTHEDFSKMLGGLGHVEAVACEVRGLDVIGKRKVSEQRTLECPLDVYDKDALRAWLRDQFANSEWTPDTYLGSQRSVTRKDGKTILNFRVYKYVDGGQS